MSILPPSLSIEDEYGPFSTLVNTSDIQMSKVAYISPAIKKIIEQSLKDKNTPTIEYSTPVPKEYMPLYNFFNGQLTPEDIDRFSHLKVAEGSFDAQFLSEKTVLSTQPDNRIIALWQFGVNAPVNAIHLTPPIVGFAIKDLLPDRFRARRVAIISCNGISTYVALVYLLTGLVSKADPIHEILRNER
jgi:hypothetical protein